MGFVAPRFWCKQLFVRDVWKDIPKRAKHSLWNSWHTPADLFYELIRQIALEFDHA